MDAFKKELLEQCKKELELLCRNIGGMTMDSAANTLVHSLSRIDAESKPENSPVYRFAAILDELRKNNFMGVSSKGQLKKILKSKGLTSNQASNMQYAFNWRLPNHLKPVRGLGRTLIDKPTIKPKEEVLAPTKNVIDLGTAFKAIPEEVILKIGDLEIIIKLAKANQEVRYA